MKVLSLFDGMSCGQIALERAGILHDGYYASEIDKHAIKVCQANYPDTIQLGDINNWENWAIDWSDVGLILAGSPCQGFSFAGKQLAFNDPRSKLFFTFVNILKFVQSFNPDIKFLLENVRMKKEYQQIITDMLGVEPVLINSALVSAQSRKRNYWCNWHVEQPEDKGILLKDILEEGDEKYFEKEIIKGGWLNWWIRNADFQLTKKYSSLDSDKLITLTARQYASWTGNFVTMKPDRLAVIGKGGQGERVYSVYGKGPTQSALGGGWGAKTGLILDGKLLIRKLTNRENARAQTIPEHNIDTMLACGVGRAQLYKMVGNGWTVDVIAHILKQGDFLNE